MGNDKTDLPDMAATIAAVLPQLRFAQVRGWLLIAVSVGIGLYLLTLLFDLPSGDRSLTKLIGIGMGLCVIGAVFAPMWTRRSHEAALMPALAGALDLTFEPKAPGLGQTFPFRLLPRNTRCVVDSLISGQMASRRIRLAEIACKTKGKNSRTLFDGIVLEFGNATALPDFFIALQAETVAGFLQAARIDTSDLILLRDVSVLDRFYGIWVTRPDKGLVDGADQIIDSILSSEGDLAGNGTLYSAMTDGQTTWLAFRKTRDIFRIGGLFATRDTLMAEVRRAAEDFNLPLRLVKRLLDAEALIVPQEQPQPATSP
jgi:hypothetical protein